MNPSWYTFLGVIIGADRLNSPREQAALAALDPRPEDLALAERGIRLDTAARGQLIQSLGRLGHDEVITGLELAWRIAAADGVPNTRELELIRLVGREAFGPQIGRAHV